MSRKIVCPNCYTKDFEKISKRKEKIEEWFIFFKKINFIDVFKCSECNNEFLESELNKELKISWYIEFKNSLDKEYANWKITLKDYKDKLEWFSKDL